MKKLTFLALITCAVFLAGCASPKTSISQDSDAKKFQPEPGKASIYINRESAFEGAAVGLSTELDGKTVGSLGSGTFLLINAAPGKHTLIVHTTRDLQLDFNTEQGKNYFFDVRFSYGFFVSHVYLTQLDEGAGEANVTASKRIVAVNQ